MKTSDLLKKVRKIEIKSRGLSQQIFSGQYHSAFKGSGMTFSEVREYQYGDPIKTIDWNVTARLNAPYIKVFEEERELTVMLLIDVSGSNQTGSKNQLKHELITEISAVLAFSAIQNNDKIGAVLFSDTIEEFIPPKKGKTHILRIIRTLLNFEPKSLKTDLSVPLVFLSSVIKKRSTAFILSDFKSDHFDKEIKIAGKKHDLIALRIKDALEGVLPKIGLIKLKNPEDSSSFWLDTSSKSAMTHYKAMYLKFEDQLSNLFRRSGIDQTIIETSKSYVKPLIQLFKQRELRR